MIYFGYTHINGYLGLAFSCPIINTKRDFSFYTEIQSYNMTGFIIGEQMRSIDFNSRNMKFIEKKNQKTISIINSIIQ